MKITKEMVEQAYEYAKKVYYGQLTRSEAKTEVSKVTGMNSGSAQDYITVFLAMMDGKEYRRTINAYATEYYLENIKKDFGAVAFNRALKATEEHVKYYNTLGKGNLRSIENIVQEYKKYV